MAYTHKMVNGKRVELTAEEITALETRDTAWAAGAFDRAMASLRRERNAKLAATDWRASSDLTLSAEWTTYRQALRDLTDGLTTEEQVNNVTWPTEPS